MSTLYHCKVCNTRSHWADERCPKDVRASNSGDGGEQGKEGDEVSKSKRGHSSRSDVLPWSPPSKGVEPGADLDEGPSELRGKAIHQKVPKGGRAAKKDPVQIPPKLGRPKIHPDRKAYMKAFMVKYRKELKLRAKVAKV